MRIAAEWNTRDHIGSESGPYSMPKQPPKTRLVFLWRPTGLKRQRTRPARARIPWAQPRNRDSLGVPDLGVSEAQKATKT